MGKELLLVSDGKTSLNGIIPDKFTINALPFSHTKDFSQIPHNVELILIDLENETHLLEALLAIRDYSPLQGVPLWGLLNRRDIKNTNLFYSFGGTKIFQEEELIIALNNFTSTESGEKKESLDVIIPALTASAKRYRLTEQMNFMGLQKNINNIDPDDETYPDTMKQILDFISDLVQPHLSIIIINDNQRTTSFIKPDPLIFKQDYQDFMNFCLNDFFLHFQSLNLEDIDETFFVGERKDFDKINMNNQKLSSYIYFPISNNRGEVEATIHLGHLRNNYFSDKIIETIQRCIDAIRGRFFYALRNNQVTLRRKKIINIFGRFVPIQILPELIEREYSKDIDTVEKRRITVLFSDIRSFTSITEQNGAQSVVDFLNRHFDVMVSIIKKHGGSIDKFIGDAIVSFFGAPTSYDDNSDRAAKAALEMIEALPKVECSGLILKDNCYGIGIGIHEGPAIIGNVGSSEKVDYTAIGDVIGIAEELEALTKNYPTHILLSEEVSHHLSPSIKVDKMDNISLGKESSLNIFAPSWEVKSDN